MTANDQPWPLPVPDTGPLPEPLMMITVVLECGCEIDNPERLTTTPIAIGVTVTCPNCQAPSPIATRRWHPS